jgi:aspartate racemase
MWKTFPFEAGETCCQKTSLSFVDSVWEIFGPLLQGFPTVIIPDAALKDLHRLVQILAIKDITRIVLVPSLLRVLLNTYPALESRLPKLKYWVTSGEALDLELSQCFQKLMPESILLNLYGSSEVSADATWYDTRKSKSLSCVPIGCPIANTQVYVLNRHLKPVPIGVRGELYIGGASLARGYLNRPELTEEKFIPNPFSDEPGAYLYKTGDLARYLSDGNIEFLGRIDHQVKVRGFRIELGEIEAVLAQHQNVRETVVTAREDIRGDKRLVAYVVPNQEQAATTSELRHLIKQKLPDYMVPSVFMMLNALPLTPNGKVDRRALPVPDQARQEPEETFIAPRDKLELQLTKIWEEVLGKKPISVRDNFFDLGGHSLLAVSLFAQIEKTFGKNLPLASLFQAPTIEQLTSLLSQSREPATWSSLVAIQPSGSKPPLFCVHGGDGEILFYRDLAHHLGLKQPFYGLRRRGLDGEQAPHTQVENMAAHYIKEIQTLQPVGPYFLGGYCFGGWVAFEIAQQLYAQGQKVSLLALFESYGPGDRKPVPLHYRISRHFSNLLRLGPTYVLEKGKGRLPKVFKNKIGISLDPAQTYWLPLPHTLQNLAIREAITEATKQAARDYRMQVYPDQVTLFQASNGYSEFYSYDSPLGWGKFADGGLELHDVPGDHGSMFREPHVQILAEKLRACLERTQEDNSGVHHP